MHCISRYSTLNDIELLASGHYNKKDTEAFATELYLGILEIVVDALNNTAVKSLPDRIDAEFRSRETHHALHLTFFEIALRIAEEARTEFLKFGVPYGAKYKLILAPTKHVNSFDRIVIDYEMTAKSIMGNLDEDKDMDMIVEYNPSLETLNDAYERVEKEHSKKGKGRLKTLPW